jgi:hypothetical protein
MQVPMVLSIASPLLWINCITFHVDPNDVSEYIYAVSSALVMINHYERSGNRFSSTFFHFANTMQSIKIKSKKIKSALRP